MYIRFQSVTTQITDVKGMVTACILVCYDDEKCPLPCLNNFLSLKLLPFNFSASKPKRAHNFFRTNDVIKLNFYYKTNKKRNHHQEFAGEIKSERS